jgi:hypothetical protein
VGDPERSEGVKKAQNIFTAEYAKDAEGIYIHCFHRLLSSVYLGVLCGERFFHTFCAQDDPEFLFRS